MLIRVECVEGRRKPCFARGPGLRFERQLFGKAQITMKIVLIALTVVAVIGVVVVIVVLFIAGRVSDAHGRTLYSSFGAWTRIQEFARAQGKTNYIAEADKTVALIERDLKQWREIAVASNMDLTPFEKMQATAYETTDRNIKNGQNPLAHLDAP